MGFRGVQGLGAAVVAAIVLLGLAGQAAAATRVTTTPLEEPDFGDLVEIAGDGQAQDLVIHQGSVYNRFFVEEPGGIVDDSPDCVQDSPTRVRCDVSQIHFRITGGDGSDSIEIDQNLGYGRSVLQGGAGDDVINGGAFLTWMRGGSGDDTLVADSYTTSRTRGEGGNDLLIGADFGYGGPGADTIRTRGGHALGQGGADVLIGSDGGDDLIGGFGDDQLRALAGDDELDGGSGSDLISAAAGNDIVHAEDRGPEASIGCGHDFDFVFVDPAEKSATRGCERRAVVHGDVQQEPAS